MHLAYLPGTDLMLCLKLEELIEIPAEETAHLKVLRLKAGENISLTNGTGGWAKAEIFDFSGKQCLVKLKSARQEPLKTYEVHLAVAPTKNIARFEWFIEKATEIGIDSISPVWCEHSERAHLRIDRLQKVAIAAMKQSLKSRLPVINEPVKLDQYLNNETSSGQRFIAWIDESVTAHLKDSMLPKASVNVLIGPEGDFSPREVELALKKEFQPVTLGPERLRTETAALVACHIVNLLNQ